LLPVHIAVDLDLGNAVIYCIDRSLCAAAGEDSTFCSKWNSCIDIKMLHSPGTVV